METSQNLPQKKARRRTGRKIFSWIVIILILMLSAFVYWKYFFTYSDGDRFGLLQKISRKGNLFKTYEGEMILSSVQSNTNIPIASEKFFFSVASKDVADQLTRLQGKHVTVHYKQKNGTLPWRGESAYIVDSVAVQQ